MDVSPISLALVFGIGLLLGLAYFAALMFTVKRLLTARRPGLLAAISFVLRMGLLLFAFVLVMGDSGERLIACVLGFLVSRTVLVRLWGPRRRAAAPAPAEEATRG